MPPLLTEFLLPAHVHHSEGSALWALLPNSRLPEPWPKGSRLLRFEVSVLSGGSSVPLNLAGSNSVAHVDLPSLLLSLPKPSEDVKVDASDIAVVGIPRVPSDFVKCALALCHPVDAKIVLDIALEEAVSLPRFDIF